MASTTLRLRLALCANALLIGCIAPSGPPPERLCGSNWLTGSRPFDSARAPDLAGEFRLVFVGTSRGVVGWVDSGQLVLSRTDSLQRYYRPNPFAPGQYVRQGDRTLIGWYRTALMRFADTAWVEHDTLHTGCLPGQASDCGSWYYKVEAVGPDGFWGHWEDPQEGIGRIVDTITGEFLPNPRGYYCAKRIYPQ